MSATGRGSARAPNDSYGTPAWAVDWWLAEYKLPVGARFLEPAVGEFNIVRAVAAHPEYASCTWDTVDIANEWDPAIVPPQVLGYSPVDFVCDWEHRGRPDRRYAAVITNPPYSLAEQYLQRCLAVAPIVCFLLRLGFLASAGRCKMHRKFPPDIYVLSRRPSFRNGRTDATDYAWFVWDIRNYGNTHGRLMVLGPPKGAT